MSANATATAVGVNMTVTGVLNANLRAPTLETAKDAAPTEALLQENELLRGRIEVLEGQVRDFAALVKTFEEADTPDEALGGSRRARRAASA